MSYQVFARKYRPRTFDDVLGQEHVVRTLRNAIAQNRLAHAYLFVGPRGTGKTSTARIFAKALNCPGGPKVDFDPNDELCVEIEKGICLDVREIDGASNNGVEQVRELREEVKFAPTRCRFKIYYIDEVHMLSTAAFNALLKTLEEPPEHVKFIFATTEAHKVLPTIISRCQRFDLRRIPTSVIARHLLHIATLEKVNLDEKAAFAIAKGAEGGMRDAQSMLDQLVAFCGERIEEQDVLDIFGFTQGETVANLAHHVLQQDTVGALQQLHAQADGGKDLSRLLSDLIQHLRTLLVHQVDPTGAEEDLSPELAEMVRNQAAAIESDRLLRVMDGLAEVDARMRWANNKLLHLEIGVIQAVQTLGEVSLSDVIHALDGGEVPKTAARRAVAPPTVPVQRTLPAATSAQKVSTPSPPPLIDTRAEAKTENSPSIQSPQFPSSPAKTTTVEPETSSSVPPELESKGISDAPEEGGETAGPVDVSTAEGLKLAWREFVSRVQVERPLFSHWVEFGSLIKVEKNIATLGLPETEEAARENLMRAGARKFVEEILSGVIGRPVLIEIVFDATLEPPPVTELSLGLLEPEAPPPASNTKEPEPKSRAKEAPAKAALEADFYDDPLINAAIEKFKATLIK